MAALRTGTMTGMLVLALACGDDGRPGATGGDDAGLADSGQGADDGGRRDARTPNSTDDAAAGGDAAVPDAGGDAAVPDAGGDAAVADDGGSLSCSNDDDCDDHDACSGVETCSDHACAAGTPLNCPAPDACHTATCEASVGCVSTLIDGDGDGHAATSLGGCGTDCDDGDPAIKPGATEITGDADDADEDCDGSPSCFANVDGDPYRLATVVASSDADCGDSGEARASSPAGDCDDGDPAINPAATEVCGNTADENCSGTTNELAECFIACDWSGARWLSHGLDGGGYTATGAWVSCINGHVSYMEFLGTSSVTPPASGTGDVLVGCNWTGTRWASQGLDGGGAFTSGSTVACDGTRVTAMAWETNTVAAMAATAGDLACNWSGARFLTHGYDGGCAFVTGFNVTCQSGRITHVDWVSTAGCPPAR